ncbi:hypothetical protein QQF64_013990 [Cirrhinus molitorella]|uniref:Uncharacterized protein n=1 Tax=Cirrhinus molitorella TaxID=172907 RepID=A0ABR3LW65_9TELE
MSLCSLLINVRGSEARNNSSSVIRSKQAESWGPICRNEITAVLLAFLREHGQAVTHSAGRGMAILQSIF